MPNSVTRGMRRLGGERFAHLVAVGPALGRSEQQEAVAQTEAHHVGGHHAEEQRGEHLGNVAPEAQHTGDAGPDGTADHAERQRDQQRHRARPADARAQVGGEPGADHELALLADVHQAGAPADGGAQAHEQDGCRDPEREAPAARLADGAVEDDRVHAGPRPLVGRQFDEHGRQGEGDEQAHGVQSEHFRRVGHLRPLRDLRLGRRLGGRVCGRCGFERVDVSHRRLPPHRWRRPSSGPGARLRSRARVIWPTMRPLKMTTMRSDRSKISSSSVEMSSTPTPLAATARSWADMYSMAPTSRPWVGCAATSTFGACDSSRRQHDTLLVAARQRPQRRVGAGAVDREAVDQLDAPARASWPGS